METPTLAYDVVSYRPIFVRFWARLEWNGSRLLRSKYSNNFFLSSGTLLAYL